MDRYITFDSCGYYIEASQRRNAANFGENRTKSHYVATIKRRVSQYYATLQDAQAALDNFCAWREGRK